MSLDGAPQSRSAPLGPQVLLRKDVLSGLMFMAVAVLGLFLSRDYPIGSAVRMGTGYVPRLLCWILLGLGAVILFRGLRSVDRLRFDEPARLVRVALLVPSSLLAFALTINRFGVVVATCALVAVGSLAGRDMRVLETVLVAAVLCAITVGIFVWGLGLTIPIWPED
jgi:putative tricarboxylic transport membrane protein